MWNYFLISRFTRTATAQQNVYVNFISGPWFCILKFLLIHWFCLFTGLSQKHCRSSAYHHTLKWENVTSHDSWIIFSLTEVSRWSDFTQITFSTFDRETVYLPIRVHLFLSLVATYNMSHQSQMDVMNPQTTGQQMQLYTWHSTRRPCNMDAVNVQTFCYL